MLRFVAALILVLMLVPGLAFGDVWYWVDKEGTQYYTTNRESIPEAYRAAAKLLSLSEAPPAPPEIPVEPRKTGITRIPFVPGSPVLVSARINGAGPITLILDTGADHTLISPAVLARLGVSTQGAYRGVLRGVTGAGMTDAVWIASLEVGEAKAGPLLVIAHDADLKGADGLLGRDFLVNFNLTIDPKERVVTFAPN